MQQGASRMLREDRVPLDTKRCGSLCEGPFPGDNERVHWGSSTFTSDVFLLLRFSSLCFILFCWGRSTSMRNEVGRMLEDKYLRQSKPEWPAPGLHRKGRPSSTLDVFPPSGVMWLSRVGALWPNCHLLGTPLHLTSCEVKGRATRSWFISN